MTASLQEIHDRAQAAFLGVALGDALGATTEFMSRGEIRAKYRVHKKIIGGGWLGLKAGHVTDDTEMSLALGHAITRQQEWDLQQIAENFLSWMRGKPIDIGSTVRKGIRSYMKNGTLEVPYNEWDAGNGAVMRMAPVALYTLGNPRLLSQYALQQARLTHHHKLSDAACICVGRMTQAAILGANRFDLHALTRELTMEFPTFKFNRYKGLASGYVVDTLQTVFHYLFTTADFEECLTGIVNQGGDADTTGAIGGMIAGAFYGPESLPKKWLKKLNPDIRADIEVTSSHLIRLSPLGKSGTGFGFTDNKMKKVMA